jgi:hypothetical protein
MRWAGHLARIGKRRDVYRVLVGRPEWWRPCVDGRLIFNMVKVKVKVKVHSRRGHEGPEGE